MNRLLKKTASKAAAAESTGGVPLGYVEDAFETRTILAGFFSGLPSVFVSDWRLGYTGPASRVERPIARRMIS